MPAIDVTSNLSDPDFATTFDVIRHNMVVNNKGRNVETDSTLSDIVGVVNPANSFDLQRIPDLERLSGAITIFTTFKLKDTDIIRFKGDEYTVDVINDYGHFGPGYVQATCRRSAVP